MQPITIRRDVFAMNEDRNRAVGVVGFLDSEEKVMNGAIDHLAHQSSSDITLLIGKVLDVCLKSAEPRGLRVPCHRELGRVKRFVSEFLDDEAAKVVQRFAHPAGTTRESGTVRDLSSSFADRAAPPSECDLP